jgi:hypothetical protein
MDCDVIAMSDLEELFEPLEKEEVAGWGREHEGRFYNGLFVSRPGAAMLAEWIEAQDEVLQRSSDWSSLSWAALGQDIIRPIARRSRYVNIPSSRIGPVPWFEWRRFLSKLERPSRVLSAQPVTVMLWNRELGPRLERVSVDAISRDRMLLARLLRIALGETTVDQEEDAWSRLHALTDIRFSTQGRRLELHARRVAAGARARLGHRSGVPSR